MMLYVFTAIMLTVINLDGIESRWTQIVSSCIDIIFQLSAELQVLDTAEVSVDTMAVQQNLSSLDIITLSSIRIEYDTSF
jgi:hypothetical protein